MSGQNPCGMYYSDLECDIIRQQIERRKKYREEFLRLRTDPCMHSKEAGYVFDEAMQRFQAMKASQTEYFQPNFKNYLFGFAAIVVPMVAYGLLVWTHRSNREKDIRCGKLKYRDRLFKFQ